MVIHANLLILSVVKILCLEIQDGDSRYFQIQNHKFLQCAHDFFTEFKKILNRHLKLYFSNKAEI